MSCNSRGAFEGAADWTDWTGVHPPSRRVACPSSRRRRPPPPLFVRPRVGCRRRSNKSHTEADQSRHLQQRLQHKRTHTAPARTRTHPHNLSLVTSSLSPVAHRLSLASCPIPRGTHSASSPPARRSPNAQRPSACCERGPDSGPVEIDPHPPARHPPATQHATRRASSPPSRSTSARTGQGKAALPPPILTQLQSGN